MRQAASRSSYNSGRESNVYGRQSTDPPRSLGATTEREHQVEDRPALNVVLRRLLVVRHLLACGCKVGAAELEPESPMPRCGFAAGCRQPSPCGRAWMAHSHAAGPARPSRACREPRLLQPAAVPPKISRCWGGGMPSFSSTLSLMREIVSSLSMSISISLPVSVFTLICHRARPGQRTGRRQNLAPRRGTHVHGSKKVAGRSARFSVSDLHRRGALFRPLAIFLTLATERPALGLGEQRRARARVADGQRVPGRGPPPRVWQRQGRGRVREPEGAKPRLQSQRRAAESLCALCAVEAC